MSNISDSAIQNDIGNSRALSNYKHSAGIRSFKRSKDGTLYATYFFKVYNDDGFTLRSSFRVRKSTDDGFTWTNLSSGQGAPKETLYPGTTCQMLETDYTGLLVASTYFGLDEYSDTTLGFILWYIDKDTGEVEYETYMGCEVGPYYSYGYPCYETPKHGLFSYVGSTSYRSYFVYIDDISDDLTIFPLNGLKPLQLTRENSFTYAGPVDAVSVSGVIHTIATTDTTPQAIKYIHYDKTGDSGNYTTPVNITSGVNGGQIIDIGLGQDGSGTLCAIYGDLNVTGTSGSLNYSLSLDDGTTWASPSGISLPSGASLHQDAWGNSVTAGSGTIFNCNLLAKAEGGFMISSIFDNADDVSRAYINQLDTTDGTTYTIGTWVDAASRDDLEITSAEFFRPMNEEISYVGNKEDTRLAYMVGHGDSKVGDGNLSVSIFQERLTNKAYPNPLTQSLPNQKNQDFYASGFIGANTTKYLNIFTTQGTSGHIARYDPTPDATSNGQGGYELITQYNTDVFFDSLSYNTPTTAGVAGSVEEDVRKIYFRPDFYLPRVYTINNGGILKRTVYLIEYFGVQYEITQIVPKFLDDEIIYYDANAYVFGPEHNPFKRDVQPSET